MGADSAMAALVLVAEDVAEDDALVAVVEAEVEAAVDAPELTVTMPNQSINSGKQ